MKKVVFRTKVSIVACVLYPCVIYLKKPLLSHFVSTVGSNQLHAQSQRLRVGTEEKHSMAYNDMRFPGRDFSRTT